jgi:hypothetical protein
LAKSDLYNARTECRLANHGVSPTSPKNRDGELQIQADPAADQDDQLAGDTANDIETKAASDQKLAELISEEHAEAQDSVQ